MRTVRKTYRVYRAKDGSLLAEGIAEACAEQLGIEIQGFRKAVCKAKAGKHKGYRIEVLPAKPIPELTAEGKPRQANQERTGERIRLAREWDAFCEPIRKKYGITVNRDDG